MKKIVTFQTPEKQIDVNKEFRYAKHAIPECSPIKLSNGNYLHVYMVTYYSMEEEIENYIYGDPDEEQEEINNMQR